MPPVKKPRLKVEGSPLDCVRFGGGKKPLVMLPGLQPTGRCRGRAVPGLGLPGQ